MKRSEALATFSATSALVEASSRFRAVLAVVGCALLLAASAQVRVPVPGTDVPMTLQLLAVLMAGFTLLPAQAVAATLLYLACGVAGMPVFAPGSAGLAGPTGGYLVGFLVGAYLVAGLRGGRNASVVRLTLAGLVGVVTVLAMGVAWKTVWSGGHVGLALAMGLWPFALKALAELALAVAAVSSLRRWKRKQEGLLG